MSELFFGRLGDMELVIHADGSCHIKAGDQAIELTRGQAFALARLLRMTVVDNG